MNDSERRVLDGRTWAEFCRALERAGDVVLRPSAPDDAFERAEGFRYLSRLTRVALEAFVEFADPAFPVLRRPAHETAKMGADNPDNHYQSAAISGRVYSIGLLVHSASRHPASRMAGSVSTTPGYGRVWSSRRLSYASSTASSAPSSVRTDALNWSVSPPAGPVMSTCAAGAISRPTASSGGTSIVSEQASIRVNMGGF